MKQQLVCSLQSPVGFSAFIIPPSLKLCLGETYCLEECALHILIQVLLNYMLQMCFKNYIYASSKILLLQFPSPVQLTVSSSNMWNALLALIAKQCRFGVFLVFRYSSLWVWVWALTNWHLFHLINSCLQQINTRSGQNKLYLKFS